MSKKVLHAFTASIAIALLISVRAFALDIIIDGTPVVYSDSMGYPFITEQGRTLVPLRATMEAFGASVDWDGQRNIAIVSLDETTVLCPIGEACIYRNGTKIPNEVGAAIIDSRTYLPIRAVLEAFDARVDYDGNVLVQRAEHASFVKTIESAPKGSKNFWKSWNNALALKNSGKYSEAAEAFKVLAPTLIAYDGPTNCAMLYNHLGYCYEMMGMYDYAAACFVREGDFWEKAGDEQSSIAAYRKAKYSRTTLQLFATVSDEKYSVRPSDSHRLVPKAGALLGVTLRHSSYGYINSFGDSIGKKLSAGLIYGTLDDTAELYGGIYRNAAADGAVIQYALQPKNLAELKSITENDPRLIRIAKDINETGASVYIRFASEMNEPTSSIFTEDYELYKEKFRYAANIFHTYAPRCAMVWSPNFSPEDTMHLYYPGDEYVDFVGISAYSEYQPETDPLGVGVDRSRFGELTGKLVSLYGYKKPIIISECGASYRHPTTGNDITDFATRQIKDFFTYLPIKYPQIGTVFLFETYDASGKREFRLEENSDYREAFVSAIKSDFFLSSLTDVCEKYSFELGNNVRIPASQIQLHSFVKTLMDDFAYVVYRIDGVDVATAYAIPYTVGVDFTTYAGRVVELECLAFDSKGAPCASRKIRLTVE
ncbi:MAG: hypothetical protein IKU43_05975 [Clostridia bacterium]|nr:hypothetical protein [Clostridia bacterium]